MSAIETYFLAGRWRNKEQGRPGLLSSHPDRAGAIAWGQHLAVERECDHVVRDESGAVISRVHYGEVAS